MSTNIPFVDCEGLAGAWTLGTVQAGFDLVHRVSLPGGFGDNVISENRHLVPGNWGIETGIADEAWTPQRGVGYVCGTPPCSGFSLLNTSKGKNGRGSGSAINSCMVDLVTYAAKCTGLDGKKGPEVVSLESVQGAHTTGRDLMQSLRNILEEGTGEQYDLTHVLMSGSSVGGAQMRHRFYPVFHRIPFRVENPERRHVITYQDAIGDLVGAKLQREEQLYPYQGQGEYASAFANKLRRKDGKFDMHVVPESGAFVRLVNELGDYWKPGESIHPPVRRYVEKNGELPSVIKPERFLGLEDKLVVKGWSWPRRLDPDRPGYVLTGAGILSYVHWKEKRLLTARECSRLMGYPDSWRWDMANSPMQASMWIGKCCPVQSGKWISSWVKTAINAYHSGEVFEDRGDVKPATDERAVAREYIHNSTPLYRQWLKEEAVA